MRFLLLLPQNVYRFTIIRKISNHFILINDISIDENDSWTIKISFLTTSLIGWIQHERLCVCVCVYECSAARDITCFLLPTICMNEKMKKKRRRKNNNKIKTRILNVNVACY